MEGNQTQLLIEASDNGFTQGLPHLGVTTATVRPPARPRPLPERSTAQQQAAVGAHDVARERQVERRVPVVSIGLRHGAARPAPLVEQHHVLVLELPVRGALHGVDAEGHRDLPWLVGEEEVQTLLLCRAILHIVSKIVAGLPISEVSSRTGVSTSTLRAWEERYGFPRVARLPGGHRRYDERDVEHILRVVAERSRGRSLAAAIKVVLDDPPAGIEPSIYAAVRRLRPDLPVLALRRRFVRGISRA